MRTKIILMTLALLGTIHALPAYSQKARIAGVVIDAANEEPLIGASVFLTQLKRGIAAGRNGEFRLSDIEPGSYTLTVSFMGYHTQNEQIVLQAGEARRLEIRLKPEAKSIEEVTITAKSEARRIREQAMPVTVISMSQLQGTVNSVEDILSKTMGVTIRSQGGMGSASRLSVRGLEGKRIGFFIDELPMSEQTNFVSVNDIPVDMIERIEIYKGVVPAKFGGSAVGGAVNIVTKEYPPKYLDASYTLSSFNTHKIGTVVRRNLSKEGIEVGGGGFYTYAENNYTMESPFVKGREIKRDHDKYENLTGAITMKARKWWFDELSLELAGIKNRKQVQGILHNIRHAENQSKVLAFIVDLKKENFLIEGLDLDMSNAYVYTLSQFKDTAMQRYDWDMNPLPPSSIYGGELGDASDLSLPKHNWANKTNLNYVIDAQHAINLNILFGHATGKPDDPLREKALGRKAVFDSRMTSCVAGLGHEYKSPADRFLNTVTGKYYFYAMDTWVTDIWGISPPKETSLRKHNWGISEAMRYRITPTLMVKASVGYEVRLPTDVELIGNGYNLQPSGNLLPERGTNVNIGLLYDKSPSSSLFQIEVNAFYSYLRDMIRYTVSGMSGGQYRNFGEMRSIGVEAEVKADLTNWFYGYINATWQDLRDTRKYEQNGITPNPTKGLRMPNIPYLLANAGLELHKENLFGFRRTNTRLFADASFVEEYFFDFEQSKNQERRIPRSLKIDLGLEYSFLNGTLTFSGKVSNLTDTRLLSEYNYPLPGRAFGCKIRYLFK